MANVKEGSIVRYQPADGREWVTARITRLNDDDTVNLVYPHRLDADAMASAERVRLGEGGYQYQKLDAADRRHLGDETVDEVPDEESIDEAPTAEEANQRRAEQDDRALHEEQRHAAGTNEGSATPESIAEPSQPAANTATDVGADVPDEVADAPATETPQDKRKGK